MITIDGKKIYFGDFHGQWNSSVEELALLVAGLWWHGYDFSAFQTPDRFEQLSGMIKRNQIPLKVFRGKEQMFDWAHLTTVDAAECPYPIDDPDVEKVLRWFHENAHWTIMAHPYDFMMDRLANLIDQQLLDAVEIVNGYISGNLSVVSWYNKLQSKGKTVPIVSGLDIHIAHGSRRPSVLYSHNFKPESDITLFSANRTGVICEECTKEAIKEAVRTCRTFVEIANDRMLIGPPEITGFLLKNDYWQSVDDDLQARRKLVPVNENLIIGGSKDEFMYCSAVDEFCLDGKKCSGSQVNIPLSFDRNTHYINLVSKKANTINVSALKVYHPLALDVYPEIKDGNCFTQLEIVSLLPEVIRDVKLDISCGKQSYSETLTELKCNYPFRIRHSWDIQEPLRPSEFNIRLNTGKVEKTLSKYLVFAESPYIIDENDAGKWDNIQPVVITGRYPEQIDEAFTVCWNGDEDLSAELRFAWNERALFFRIHVKDDVLAPSKKTKLLMFGDCFQIGLNPVASEAVGNQSFYDIMMTRGTENGDEKAFMERPPFMALEYPLSCRTVLQGLYKGEVGTDGYDGLLTLPYRMIPPLRPLEGNRFGLFTTVFDNDGTGLKTALQWPLWSEKYNGQAWYIPYYGAWANIKMVK